MVHVYIKLRWQGASQCSEMVYTKREVWWLIKHVHGFDIFEFQIYSNKNNPLVKKDSFISVYELILQLYTI